MPETPTNAASADTPASASTLVKARFEVREGNNVVSSIPVSYNPNTLVFEKKPKIATIPIPGLDSPLQQFVRGEIETLTVDLFFDTSDKGWDKKATSVTTLTDPFYNLVKIDPQKHAPKVYCFAWGQAFPGDQVPESNQQRHYFQGLITSIKQEFKLFAPDGTPLRAKITISLNEYKTLDQQLKELNLQSPDHTRVHVLSANETLADLSHRYYLSLSYWKTIAEKNGIDDPRRLRPGTALVIPPLD